MQNSAERVLALLLLRAGMQSSEEQVLALVMLRIGMQCSEERVLALFLLRSGMQSYAARELALFLLCKRFNGPLMTYHDSVVRCRTATLCIGGAPGQATAAKLLSKLDVDALRPNKRFVEVLYGCLRLLH